MLTSQQMEAFKNTLLARKKELLSQLEQNNHYNTEMSLQDSMDELSNYDNHPADTGTFLYEREKDIALNEHSEKELKDIQHALNRIKSHTYGQCEACGKDVGVERLVALPTTTFCLAHSPDQDVHTSRPVAEDVLNPNFERYDQNEDSIFYDAEDSWQDVARYGTSNTPSDFAARDIENYSQTYFHSDEPVSYVEEFEAFLGNDLHGKNPKVYPNQLHEEYEERLDEADMMSIMGDIHYSRTDGYVDEETKQEE